MNTILGRIGRDSRFLQLPDDKERENHKKSGNSKMNEDDRIKINK